ncbi:hypothetical protein DW1_2105 [Proteiniborus sp. DW1]|nr:hypothetical protein DW1_2105 [Proteiniborus sp. DW1]
MKQEKEKTNDTVIIFIDTETISEEEMIENGEIKI